MSSRRTPMDGLTRTILRIVHDFEVANGRKMPSIRLDAKVADYYERASECVKDLVRSGHLELDKSVNAYGVTDKGLKMLHRPKPKS